MKEQIQKLLASRPFHPFVVEVADEVVYAIPTAGHVLAGRNVLVIEDDDGTMDIVPYAHMRRLRLKSAA